MEGLLTASSTRRISDQQPSLVAVSPVRKQSSAETVLLTSSDDALRILKSQPDIDSLLSCLQWLIKSSNDGKSFNIWKPSPQAAQVINSIVNDIVPSHWGPLHEIDSPLNQKVRKLLVQCLISVAGIGALATRLRALIEDHKREGEKVGKPKTEPNIIHISDCISVLESLLESEKTFDRLWTNIRQHLENPMQRALLWKELVSWLASGRLLSITAEGAFLVRSSPPDGYEDSWLGDGRQYASWLASNIRGMEWGMTLNNEKRRAKAKALSKALSLGYTGNISSVQDKLFTETDRRRCGYRILILLLYSWRPAEITTR